MMFLAPIVLVCIGFAALFGTRLAYGVRGPDPTDSFYLLLRIVSWLLIAGGCTVWLLLSVGALPICVILGVLTGFAVVDTVRSSREMHRRSISKMLAIAVREGQLPQTLELVSQSNSGWFVGEAAGQLAYALESGEPLYESVARHPAALPRLATPYAAIGTLASAEADALDELSAPDNPQLNRAWRWWTDQFAYGIALLLTMGIMLGLFSVFIIPQFEQVFWEFALELPPVTELLVLGLSRGGSFWGMIVLAMTGLLIGMFVVAVFYLLDTPVLQRVTDWLFLKKHSAGALRMLALALEHRTELPRALYALSVTHPVRAIRNRMSAAYQDVAAGQPWADVLMHNRLLSPNEKGLVETAEVVGNLPWALRRIATRRESQLVARLTTIGHFVYPLMILAVGAFVGLVVVALFIPIVKLISGLA